MRLLYRALRLDGRRERLQATVSKFNHIFPKSRQRLDDSLSRFGLCNRCSGRRLDRSGSIANFCLDFFSVTLHLQSALVRDVGKSADFLCDDGEASPVISSAGCFDSRIKGKQICLIGDAAYRAGDRAHILSPAFKFAYDFGGGFLPLRVAFDGLNRGGDLGASFGQQDLCSFGSSPGVVGFPSGSGQVTPGLLYRRQLLLRRTRGFIGASRDLFHGLSKLFGRR